MKKRLILTICTVIMLFASMIPLTVGASASSGVQIECTVTYQSETSVIVDVSVTNNPGFMYLELTKDFPSEFSLTSISNGSLISDLTKGTKYIWIADEDVTSTGTLCTLVFSIPEGTAPGNYTVSLGVGMCGNYDEQSVGVSISSCTVTVACNHSFTKEDTSATYLKSEATCTSPAFYYKSCITCGAQGTETFEYGSTEPHTYTRKVTTDTYKKSAASCTEKAVYYFCCATCNAKDKTSTYENGETLPHSYTRQVITDDYKVSAADCDSKAVYNYCCATCDAVGSTTFEYGSILGHTGGTATCTAKAECTRCHQPYGEMLEHVYTAEDATDTYLKSAATCTSKAVYYKNCATCDKAGTATFEYGSTEPHSYTRQVTTATYLKSAATCTSKAVYYHCCATCDAKGTTTFEHGTTLSHNYTRKVVTDTYKKSAATCTEAAVYYFCCATCDAKGTTTYANGSKLGHTGGTATCTAKAECTRCNEPYGEMLEHVYTDEDATDAYLKDTATCTSEAVYYKNCATCDKAGEVTFKHGTTTEHVYERQVISDTYKVSGATCTSQAVYKYCCETCDKAGEATFKHGTTLEHSYEKEVIFDDYKVSDADCNNKAVYKYCCETCDKAGTETFEYGEKLGHTGGTATCTAKAECTRCNEPYGELLDHMYDKEEAQDKYLASKASCLAKAKYYKSCSCGEKGTATFEYGEKEEHSYTQKLDASYLKSEETCTTKAVYYESCSVCGEKGTVTFETGDDPSHNYKTTWSTDASSHWHECSKCGDKKDSASHTAGAAATSTTAQTCTVCGYVITPAYGHTHRYSSSWSSDANNHWHECSGCNATKNKSAHSYKNDCDTDCDVCGYVRTVTHSHNTEWSKDAQKHWYECSVCGDKKNETTHTPGADATETTDQTCTVCGYVIKEALGHTHNHNTIKNDENNHWNECACGDKINNASHSDGNKDEACDGCGYGMPIDKPDTTEAPVTTEKPDTPQMPEKDDKYIKEHYEGKEKIKNDDFGASIRLPKKGDAVIPEGAKLEVAAIPATEIVEETLAEIETALGRAPDVLAFYDLSITLDNSPVQPNGKILVTLPAPDVKYDEVNVLFIADDGSFEVCVTFVNEDGTISFETDHFSKYVIVGTNDVEASTGASGKIIAIVSVAVAVIAIACGAVIFIKKKKA